MRAYLFTFLSNQVMQVSVCIPILPKIVPQDAQSNILIMQQASAQHAWKLFLLDNNFNNNSNSKVAKVFLLHSPNINFARAGIKAWVSCFPCKHTTTDYENQRTRTSYLKKRVKPTRIQDLYLMIYLIIIYKIENLTEEIELKINTNKSPPQIYHY